MAATDPGGVLGQDRSSVNRAVSGALPATLLLLIGCLFAPAAALATDVPCDRASSLAVPSERLQVRIMDLTTRADAADETAPGREVSDESLVPGPDLSSRARSLAILREIFGETVGDDDLDVARMPAHDVPAGTPESPEEQATVRRPTAEVSGSELPAPGASASEDADTDGAEAGLPGVSEEDSRRYRRQMYRTDI